MASVTVVKCQDAAGVLDGNGKLTKGARDKFIKDVKDRLRDTTFDFNLIPLCPADGLKLKPFAIEDLEDEKKYPIFHSIWLGLYEVIANILNLPGGVIAPPIFDITFVIPLIDPNIKLPSISLPDLQFQLIVPTLNFFFDYQLKLPPKLPALPPLPSIPSIPFPSLNLDIGIKIPAFEAFIKFPEIIFSIFLDFAVKIPDFALKLPFDFLGELCLLIKKAFPRPSPTGKQLDGDSAVALTYVQLIAAEVLIAKMTECLGIALVGSTIGASGAGFVGAMGAGFGYREPLAPAQNKEKMQTSERLNKCAKELSALSAYVASTVDIPNQDGSVTKKDIVTDKKYVDAMFPADTESFKSNSKLNKTTGAFVRALLTAAGSSRDAFKGTYESSFGSDDKKCVDKIIEVAKEVGAVMYEEGGDTSVFSKDLASTNVSCAVYVGGDESFGGDDHFFVPIAAVDESSNLITRQEKKLGAKIYNGAESGHGTATTGYGIERGLYDFYLSETSGVWAARHYNEVSRAIEFEKANGSVGDANQASINDKPNENKFVQAKSRKVKYVIDLVKLVDKTKL